MASGGCAPDAPLARGPPQHGPARPLQDAVEELALDHRREQRRVGGRVEQAQEAQQRVALVLALGGGFSQDTMR